MALFGQVDDGLVVQFEFPRWRGPAQILLHDASGLHLQVHGRLEEAESAAAVAFGPVQREVGVAQEFVGASAVAGADRDADAGADDGLVPIDIVGLVDRFDDVLRERGGLAGSVSAPER